MLQPLQLEDVSFRYAPEIAELHDFFAKSGLPLAASETLPALTARLHEDRAFRRDLTSHVWVAIHASGRRISYSDLLAMLAIAAAGTHVAAAADETDAHALLRFLMDTKGSFDTVPAEPGLPLRFAALAPAPREAHKRLADPLLWATATACLLLAFVTGLWLHGRSGGSSGGSSGIDRPIPAASISKSSASAETAPETVASNEDTTPLARQPVARQPMDRQASSARSPSHPPTPLKPASSREFSIAIAPASTRALPAKPSPATPAVAALPSPAPVVRPLRKAQPALPYDISKNVPLPKPLSKPLSRRTVRANPPPAPDPDNTAASAARRPIVLPTSLGTMAANVLYSPAPAYPSAASALHVQGEVKLEAEVDRDGKVISTRIISGPPLLQEAAADAVQRWRYRPFLSDGRPIAMNAPVVIDFQLP